VVAPYSGNGCERYARRVQDGLTGLIISITPLTNRFPPVSYRRRGKCYTNFSPWKRAPPPLSVPVLFTQRRPFTFTFVSVYSPSNVLFSSRLKRLRPVDVAQCVFAPFVFFPFLVGCRASRTCLKNESPPSVNPTPSRRHLEFCLTAVWRSLDCLTGLPNPP